MAIPHHEWRTQHPASRPPLKLRACTWDPTVVKFVRADTVRDSQRYNIAHTMWRDYKSFCQTTLVFRWHKASHTPTAVYCPGTGSLYTNFEAAVQSELSQLPTQASKF